MLTGNRELSMFVVQVLQNRECNKKPAVLFLCSVTNVFFLTNNGLNYNNMKKIVLLIWTLIAATQWCLAQDFIITRDAKRIEAKVTEISDEEVRYKKFNNPDGPVYVIKASQISSIMFANGEVQLFSEKTEKVETKEPEQKSQMEVGSGYRPFVVNSGRVVAYTPGLRMDRSGGTFSYGGVALKDDVYEEFLKETCPDAAAKYGGAKAMDVIGDIFLYSGSFCVGWGLADLILDYYSSGMSWILWGVSLSLTSIPFYIIEFVMKNKSVAVFNETCASKPLAAAAPDLSFKVSPTGFGLAFSF